MAHPDDLVFACAHLTDERLYAHQVQALSASHHIQVMAFRDHSTLAGMANELLAAAPPRFTLIGLSLGGYLAFEVLRRASERVARLVLLDTSARADTEAKQQGRRADIAKVQQGGIEALIPELPRRWLHPAHLARTEVTTLMASMARGIGAMGQFNQQQAMLGRPDSFADLSRVTVPTLIVCGREDPVTTLADHEAMHACAPGSRLAVIEDCGHLSTIERPEAVSTLLVDWLGQTGR